MIETEKEVEKDVPQKEKSEIEILKEKLSEAISSENYEEAAKIRDEIRSKEGK